MKLQEFIAHCGEPLHNKGAHNDTQQHNQSAQDDTTEIAVLRREIEHLLRVIEELRADRDLQRHRETWLQGIIDRRGYRGSRRGSLAKNLKTFDNALRSASLTTET